MNVIKHNKLIFKLKVVQIIFSRSSFFIASVLLFAVIDIVFWGLNPNVAIVYVIGHYFAWRFYLLPFYVTDIYSEKIKIDEVIGKLNIRIETHQDN